MAVALELKEKNSNAPEDVERIKVFTFNHAWRLYQGIPETTEQAQFSVKWPMAALLIDGEAGPNQILEHRLGDHCIRNLAEKIESETCSGNA